MIQLCAVWTSDSVVFDIYLFLFWEKEIYSARETGR